MNKADKGFSYIAAIIILGLMMWALVGCMSDRVALQKVLTKQPLFDRVGQIYMGRYPCDNKVVKAKSDTIIKHDSSISYEPYYIDCPDVYDTVKPKQVKVFIPVKTYINNTKIIDSITRIDGQQLAILNSKLQERDKQIAALNQAVTTANLSTVQEHSRGNGWELYFWLLIAAIVIVILLVILKPKI